MNPNKTDNFIVDFSVDPLTGKEKHDYLLDGKPLTGVTTILKVLGKGDAITQWSSNICSKKFSDLAKDSYFTGAEDPNFDGMANEARYAWKKELESAGKFGKNVHKAIEMFVKGETGGITLDDREEKAYENFKEWFGKSQTVCLESERSVYSKTHWYAGTIDLILEDSLGKIWIGDVKTSASVYPEHFFQTAAYQYALLERGFDRPIEGHVIINVKKDGRMDIKRSYGYERNIKAFLAALEIHRIKQDLEAELKVKKY